MRLLFTNLQKLPKHPLFRLALIGLSIRLVLAPMTQFTYDPVVWYSTGNDMLAGLSPYYTKTYSYPPLWAYTFFPFLLIAASLVDPRTFAIHLSQMDWISVVLGYYSSTVLSPVLLLAIKLPIILADMTMGWLIYRFVKGYSGFNAGRKAYVFWLFNPLVIWTSSIHGNYDVLPALFTVISFVTLLRGKYFQSGMSLAVAVLYKLYPLYLLPLFAVLVWTDLGRDRQHFRLSRAGLTRLGFLTGGGLVPFLAILPFVSIQEMLHAVFIRGSYLSSLGGISPWMLNAIPGLGGITEFASNYLQVIQLATTAFALTVSLLMGLWAIRKRTPDFQVLLRAMIVSISAIFLTLLTVQPQYLEWILPFLTVSAFTAGLYRLRSLLVTSFAVLFEVSLAGTLVFLPLVYFGVNADWITGPVKTVLSLFQSSFSPPLVIFGSVGGVVLLSFLFRRDSLPQVALVTKLPSIRPKLSRSDLRRSLKAISTVFLTAFIITITLSAVLVHTIPAGRFLLTGTKSSHVGDTLTIQNSFVVSTGSLPLQLNLVAAPLTTIGADEPVFIYYDPRYPALGNDPRGWIGVTDHLPAELNLRGFSGQVQVVNASALRQVMIQNFTSVVVIPSGVFPTTVQNSTKGLAGNWMRGGGTLVWMGGPFGFYSDPSSQHSLNPAVTDFSIVSSSQTRILGYSLEVQPLNDSSRIATLSTPFSSGLNLTYSDVWVAPTLGLLKSVGGLAIGHLQNSSDVSRSSESIIPVGTGRLILFGGPVTGILTTDGEDGIAHDLAQVLSLGNIATAAGIGFTTYTLPAQTSTPETFTASFNVKSLKVTGIVLAAFSDYSFSRLYWRSSIPAT